MKGKILNDVIQYGTQYGAIWLYNNCERMKYGSLYKKGYFIGSITVEAAHRNMIQQRLKMLGKIWSIDGAQRIANIRT